MFINLITVVIFAFFMASVLNTKFFGRGFARSVMFLPVIVSSGVAATLTSNDLAGSVVSSGFASTGEDVTSAFGQILLDMDLSDGIVSFITSSVDRISTITTLAAVSIVIFIAGLQSISSSVYEAAYMEGATPWETFWKISLPMVSPMILLSIVYTVVDSFTSDDNAAIAIIHNQLVNKGEYAIASTMAVIYSLIILAILGIIFAVLSKIIFYQD
jgi:ABC-type sugar transport system permease subunit